MGRCGLVEERRPRVRHLDDRQARGSRGPATITAKGLSARCLRRRSSATAGVAVASHARW